MQKSVNIFLGYATEDKELCFQVKKRLRWLEREGLVKTWHEYSISAGIEREKEIQHYLELAQIILLFISADFIDTDFCYCDQLKWAMERHKQGKARVIPIILRSVYWQETPLGILQALPKNNVPVKNWPDLDAVLAEVEEDIRIIVKELVTEKYIQEGRWLFNKRCYEQALDACEYALRLAPISVIASRLKGLALLELKRYDEALIAYDQAIHFEPETASIYKERGDAFYHLTRYSEAILSYQEAIAHKPDLTDAYIGISKALYAQAKVNIRQAQEYEEKARMLLALTGKSSQEDFK